MEDPPENHTSPSTRPYFFFSYARKDRDDFLDRFYKDLRNELEGLGLDVEGAGVFRDLDEISPGEDYDDVLAAALKKSLTLVCIYSPWYFKRPYCWMEFQAFLDRQSSLRYEEGMARGVRGIIPVLWQRKKVLEDWGLPPDLVRKLQVTIDRIDSYREQGLQGVMRREGRIEGSAYWEVLEELAYLIFQEVRQDPLPELSELPSTREAWTAARAERDAAVARAAVPPPEPARIDVGPTDLVLCYAATGADDQEYATWKPFPAERSSSIRLLVEEIAADVGQRCSEHVVRVGSDVEQAGDHIVGALRNATERNALALLVLHPALLDSGRMKPLIERVVRSGGWRGGIVTPSSAEAAPLIDAILQQTVDPEGEVALTGAVHTLPAFERRLLILLNELLRRLIIQGKVVSGLPSDGPSSMPRLAGPRRRHADVG